LKLLTHRTPRGAIERRAYRRSMKPPPMAASMQSCDDRSRACRLRCYAERSSWRGHPCASAQPDIHGRPRASPTVTIRCARRGARSSSRFIASSSIRCMCDRLGVVRPAAAGWSKTSPAREYADSARPCRMRTPSCARQRQGSPRALARNCISSWRRCRPCAISECASRAERSAPVSRREVFLDVGIVGGVLMVLDSWVCSA
jgi:hypothetical protein